MIIITDEIKTRSPFKDLFTIKSSTLSAITKSMKKDGFNEAEPLVYWQVKGVGHVLVDGHTRLESAKQAGLTNVHAIRMDFDNELKAVEYAISRQKNRRNLTDAEMLNCLNELDELRQEKGKNNGGNQYTKGGEAPHGASAGKSSKQTAETLGVSARKVERARTIQDHADEETVQAVKDGNMSINKAYNETQAKRKAEAKEAEPVDDTKFVEYNEEEEFEAKLLEYSVNLSKALKDKGLTHEEFAFVVSNMSYD